MHTSLRHALAAAPMVAALAFAGNAMAQYAGPSTVPSTNVKQLLDSGVDDQHATLTGRIVSHDGGKRYTFADATGRIVVEISARHFPAGQPVDDKREVEITGELDKDRDGVEFEVDRLRVL